MSGTVELVVNEQEACGNPNHAQKKWSLNVSRNRVKRDVEMHDSS